MAIDKVTAATLTRLLEATRDVVMFQPDPNQRRAKSNYWTHFAGSGTEVAPAPNLATALQFGADRRISAWWDLPGFQDWFLNRDEFRQRLEYLSAVGLDALESILTGRMSSDSDKLNAIKLIMAVSKPGQPDSEQMADAAIGKMTRQQLQEYISRNMKLVPSPTLEEPQK